MSAEDAIRATLPVALRRACPSCGAVAGRPCVQCTYTTATGYTPIRPRVEMPGFAVHDDRKVWT